MERLVMGWPPGGSGRSPTRWERMRPPWPASDPWSPQESVMYSEPKEHPISRLDPGNPHRLTPALRALVRVSAALATRKESCLRSAMAQVRDEAAAEEVEEVLVQSYLFIGFPGALNALSVWREFSGWPASPPMEDDPLTRARRGEAVCRQVYGGQYERLRRNVRELHPDLDRWMVEEGYGKVLGRPGLDLPERELCIAALLAVLGAPVQLYSHLRGALEVGVGPDEVEAMLREVADVMPPTEMEEVRHVWRRVRERAGRSAAPDS
ncbi:MAG: carboxymuconolactone decarboxylase family protein [Gemmatimonadales bacterium]|nr:MAG: carboxymuconolactone decarboxylase family protein [Gemmatimonadales bacterium]